MKFNQVISQKNEIYENTNFDDFLHGIQYIPLQAGPKDEQHSAH